MLLSPGAIGVILLIPIVVKLMCIVQTRLIIVAGFFMMRCAFASSSKHAVDIDFTTLVIMRTAQTAALAFLFVPMKTIAFATLLGELNGDATALFAVFRYIFGSIGVSVATAMVPERTQIHQSYLPRCASPFNQSFYESFARSELTLTALGRAASAVHDIAVRQTYEALRTQAAVLACSDVFLLAGVGAFAVIPFRFVLSGTKGGSGALH